MPAYGILPDCPSSEAMRLRHSLGAQPKYSRNLSEKFDADFMPTRSATRETGSSGLSDRIRAACSRRCWVRYAEGVIPSSCLKHLSASRSPILAAWAMSDMPMSSPRWVSMNRHISLTLLAEALGRPPSASSPASASTSSIRCESAKRASISKPCPPDSKALTASSMRVHPCTPAGILEGRSTIGWASFPTIGARYLRCIANACPPATKLESKVTERIRHVGSPLQA